MKLLYVTSEATPFVKTGGLGDVGGALPKALAKQGIDVRVVMPLYASMSPEWREKLTFVKFFYFSLAWRNSYCGLFMLEKDGVTYYFIDNEQYFKRQELYGSYDDGERFAYFSKAVVEMLPHLGWRPDIIHCNDWQTAVVPLFVKAYGLDIKTLFTIHNIEYQGRFDFFFADDVLSLPPHLREMLEYYGGISLMKGAIVGADAVTTVSPTYAGELTHAYYAHGMETLLCAEADKFSGILNGIDVEVFHPSKDNSLFKKYSSKTLNDKVDNKTALQELLGLDVDAGVPMVGMVSRLVAHKGLDLVAARLDDIMAQGVQFVVLGSGEWAYEQLFTEAQRHYPGRFSSNILYNAALANQIYAGADIFLMPSKSEPCGLSQMIAMQYGTLPVVRETGGLRDTVKPYNAETGEGNGFTFANYNADEMLQAVQRAIALYRDDPKAWRKLQTRDMTTDWSWSKSAGEHIVLYEKLLHGDQLTMIE
ncbi:MAG: glycogen synthase GlgA [Oscillospiraceae bacterium]|nr:glycogen synthase GlgA [Oscillospiraceae bacterium]